MCQSCKGVKEWKRGSCRFVHTLLPPLLALLGMVQACLVLGTQLPSPSIPPTLLSAGYLSPSDLTCIRRPWTIELCYCCCGGLRHLCNWSSTELQVSEFTLTFFFFSEQRNNLEERKLARKKFSYARKDDSINIYSSRRE